MSKETVSRRREIRIKDYHLFVDYQLWKEARIEAIKADISMRDFTAIAIRKAVEQSKKQAGEKK